MASMSNFRLHRWLWRMLEMKCVADNLQILVTLLAMSVTNILYFLILASGTNIQKCHQDSNSVANMTVTAILWACLDLKNFLLIHFCRSIKKLFLKSRNDSTLATIFYQRYQALFKALTPMGNTKKHTSLSVPITLTWLM